MWFLLQLQKLYHIEASTLVTYEANMFVTNFKEFPLFDIISEGNSHVLNTIMVCLRHEHIYTQSRTPYQN